jgi:predicted phosphodiesterase
LIGKISITMSQPNPLPFRLMNTKATVYEIPPSVTTAKLGLIISDQHFGQYADGIPQIQAFLQEFRLLLSHVKPDYLLLLGDTLDAHCANPDAVLQNFLENLEQFQIPIFLLAGNHDRDIFQQYSRHHPWVTIVRCDLAVGATATGSDGGWKRIVFGHDLMNNFLVHPSDASVFVWWMKAVFHEIVGPNELLFLGHTHQNIWDEEHKCGSVGRFAPAAGHYRWAVVRENRGFTLTFGTAQDYEKFAEKLNSV